MSRLVTDKSDLIRRLVFRLLGADAPEFGPSVAIGVESGDGKSLYAGMVYHNWDARNRVMTFTLASVNPRWATPPNVRALLSYPFQQLGCTKLMAIIPNDNGRSLRLASVNLGNGVRFKKEATLRHQFGRNRHGIVVSLMDDEWRRSKMSAMPEVVKEAA
jgi:hypothetical protein